MEKFKFIVSPAESGQQIKKLVKSKYHLSSRLMTKIKYQDLLLLNGKKVPGYIVVNEGDEVIVSIPDERSNFEPLDIPLDIIYEDQDLLIINKQAGVTCHPTKGHPTDTMANAIMKYMLDTNQSFKIRFVNRLDMDTSGVLVTAKNSYAQAELNKQMMRDLTDKTYMAIVSGVIDINKITYIKGISLDKDYVLIDLPIGKPAAESKRRSVIDTLPHDWEGSGIFPCKTAFRIIETFAPNNGKEFPGATLIELKLLTGRTHQIRVHMSHLGHPLLGDFLYEGPCDLIKRQALHALSYTCNHPMTGQRMTFQSKTPPDLEGLITKLRNF